MSLFPCSDVQLQDAFYWLTVTVSNNVTFTWLYACISDVRNEQLSVKVLFDSVV